MKMAPLGSNVEYCWDSQYAQSVADGGVRGVHVYSMTYVLHITGLQAGPARRSAGIQ